MIPAPVAAVKNTRNAVVDNKEDPKMNSNYKEKIEAVKKRYKDLRDLL
jgi:hypothetical protein